MTDCSGMDSVTWTEMADGSRQDYEMLATLYSEHTHGEIVTNLVSLLKVMQGPKLGYQIDRYEHSLQAASRALRADERLDVVMACLLHDVADSFAPENHSATAAAMLAPYIDDEMHWVVKHHGLFQGYYYFHHLGGDRNARNAFADHHHFDMCVRFCAEYDQNSFDPDYPTLPIEDFLPLMDDFFSRESKILGVAPPGTTKSTPIN